MKTVMENDPTWGWAKLPEMSKDFRLAVQELDEMLAQDPIAARFLMSDRIGDLKSKCSEVEWDSGLTRLRDVVEPAVRKVSREMKKLMNQQAARVAFD